MVPDYDIDQLKAALNLGPVGVTVQAENPVFRHYGGDILDSIACGTDVGHAVLAVGYGTHPEKGDYITIKNSWGEDWGEDGGFARISLSQKYSKNGVCGILT